jgi:hypothetical protein
MTPPKVKVLMAQAGHDRIESQWRQFLNRNSASVREYTSMRRQFAGFLRTATCKKSFLREVIGSQSIEQHGF